MKAISKLLKFINLGTEYLCPFPCLCCGTETGDGKNLFCAKCIDELSMVKNPRCPGCGGPLDGVLKYCSKCMEFEKRPWDGAFALFNLEGTGQQLVYAFKFYGRPELARPFAALAKNSLKSEIDKIDMIVPVPLHWTRSFSRGYNQSALFCEELAKSMNIKYSPVLRRIKRTRQQAKLDRKQRQKNLSGAFAIKAGTDLKNKTILLVDDVMTTGATLSAAARTFDNCDLKGLYTLVIGRR